MPSNKVAIRQLANLDGFTNLAPDGDDVFPYFDNVNSGNRDCTLDQMLDVCFRGLKNGLSVDWESSTQIRVKTGIAQIESSGRFLRLSSDSVQTPTLKSTLTGTISNTTTPITVIDASLYPTSGRIKIDSEEIDYVGKNSTQLGTTSCTRGANGTTATSHTAGASVGIKQWWFVYLGLSGSTPTVFISTTAPASPWFGNAASMTGDSSKRLIGEFLTDRDSNIYNFLRTGTGALEKVSWRNRISEEMRILTLGQATVNTSVSLAKTVPPYCRLVGMRIFSNANVGMRFDSSDMTGTDPAGGYGSIALSVSGGDVYPDTPCNSNQEVRYAFLTGGPTNGGGAYFDTYHYYVRMM